MASGSTRALSVLSRLSVRKSNVALRRCTQLRHRSTEAQRTPGQWQLVSAVCLQRPPVITAEQTPLEQQYAAMMAQMELESSLLSDHELHAKEDKAIEEKRKKMEESDAGEGEVEGARVTALDLEDAWEAETKLFTPTPRVTEADKTGDQQSIERCLDKPLLLLVRQTLGSQTHWVFPQGLRQDGESMRQAAERVLNIKCGDAVKAKFLGNAPCGFYQYKFPPTANIGTGAKVFFFKAWYQDGEVEPNKDDVTDFKWVTMDQLSQFCSKQYLNSVSEFLVDL